MDKIYLSDVAVISDGRCDLNGLPCLRALNLARQMARASASLDAALPETFGLEAEVEISDCLRVCHLVIALSAGRVAVSRSGNALASVELPALSAAMMAAGASPCAAVGWRGH